MMSVHDTVPQDERIVPRTRRHIEIYDTTLRDGSQAEGVAFSVEAKLRLLQEFDAIGIDFVEGGWPFSNPRDQEFYRRAALLPLKHARLVPFGSTRRKEFPPEEDPNLHSLVETKCQAATIFGKKLGPPRDGYP
ncbi:MAG: hypothetical protein KatS3mg115_1149 [Candidatus Poribacteria bacterium]|nr:MAG: hypothetical protein KatS3mg115_1149 [Candidatus Poribacteria bacterium]